ncbi:uncharacterized protein PRCAT00005452001 [Priceomyces carsonii]|uniref:uncharacterized protein n=1 Tax=Priceomyces carsonii TaxID=28549 RepID=UPI002EDA3B31|nr:unnamed protein product [Priceomyces carsonii]
MSYRYSHGGAQQRDLRTQLFEVPPRKNSPVIRNNSPYDPVPSSSAKHTESFLLSLESQNNDEVDTMGQKVTALKNLGVRMGSEINKSMNLNDEITNSFERGRVSLKNTFNRMIIMSKRAGITWKMWLFVFFIVFLWFFWIWLF